MESSNGESKAQICLSQGGRLSNLVFENTQILAPHYHSGYKDNYASSILFPFANRIKDGKYTYSDSLYKLECNETHKNNALHGLVYNKTFVYVGNAITSDYASVTLQYQDEGKCKGFPFKFNIELTYKLSESGLNLSIKVLNEDEKTFPFTIGWHPYFNSQYLDISSISFKSNSRYLFDNQKIIIGQTSFDVDMPFQLKEMELDDCYLLKTDEVEFLTPDYSLKMTSTSKNNFLQLYTPNQPNIIAIELMTGAPNNFNNHIGLQKIKPKETYNVKWNLTIDTDNTKKPR